MASMWLQGVGEEALSRLFRRYPGMEYCDLKKDRETGKSKVSLPLHAVCALWLWAANALLVHACTGMHPPVSP